MPEVKMDGTVRALRVTDVRKKDVETTVGHIVIMNEMGNKVVITGSEHIVDGLNPDDNVVVTVKRANKTLKEALSDDKEKAAKK